MWEQQSYKVWNFLLCRSSLLAFPNSKYVYSQTHHKFRPAGSK